LDRFVAGRLNRTGTKAGDSWEIGPQFSHAWSRLAGRFWLAKVLGRRREVLEVPTIPKILCSEGSYVVTYPVASWP